MFFRARDRFQNRGASKARYSRKTRYHIAIRLIILEDIVLYNSGSNVLKYSHEK